MKTMIYLVGFGDRFNGIREAGWGCGYVMIPIEHPIVKDWQDSIERAQSSEDQEEEYWFGYFRYLQVGDEEITYTERTTVNGQEYVVIGFDTAHGYNSPEVNDFQWVLNTTLELQRIVDEYVPTVSH